MFGLGLPELIVIFLVILLLFGAKSLPEIAKGLGQAIKIFKREAKDIQNGLDEAKDSSAKSEEKTDAEDKNA